MCLDTLGYILCVLCVFVVIGKIKLRIPTMNNKVLVTGGCRSGKSRHALELANRIPGDNRIFIATLNPLDKEMEDRVHRHRTERSDTWHTVEEPLLLAEALDHKASAADVILVDCLTLWVTNLLMAHEEPALIESRVKALAETISKIDCPLFLVTNEVGSGIVPENRLARLFRDQAGFCNQVVAMACDQVIWMVAGLPVKVK